MLDNAPRVTLLEALLGEVRPDMKRSMKLFERLLDTDVKADLLTLFHNNAKLADTPEELAKRIGRSSTEVQRELEDLVELGILKKSEVYSFAMERDKEIQDAISKQLALGEVVAPEFGRPDLASSIGVHALTTKTGLDILDGILTNGLPASCTVLVLSDPGAGEENLLTHFVSTQMQARRSIIYITLDNFPANIRQLTLSRFREERVDWSSLIIIDCYSKTVGVESEEPYIVDPENLSAISIALSDVMTKEVVSLMILDSFNTLIRKRGIRSALEFLRVLVARARQAKCMCLITMNRKAFHVAYVASAQDVVDGVIELRVEESYEGIARSLRVLKMVGARHLTTWIPYEISDDGVLVKTHQRRLLGTP